CGTSGEDVTVEQHGASWVRARAEAEAHERRHAAEWERVHEKLGGLAERRAKLDAEEAHLLRYAEEIKLWRGFGCGSMMEYLERELGYRPHTASERLRVARLITDLPLIAEALEQGELSHSAVRELSRVAVPETEDAWLEAVRGKCVREIEAMVSGHKAGDLPRTRPSRAYIERRSRSRSRHVGRRLAVPTPRAQRDGGDHATTQRR